MTFWIALSCFLSGEPDLRSVRARQSSTFSRVSSLELYFWVGDEEAAAVAAAAAAEAL